MEVTCVRSRFAPLSLLSLCPVLASTMPLIIPGRTDLTDQVEEARLGVYCQHFAQDLPTSLATAQAGVNIKWPHGLALDGWLAAFQCVKTMSAMEKRIFEDEIVGFLFDRIISPGEIVRRLRLFARSFRQSQTH